VSERTTVANQRGRGIGAPEELVFVARGENQIAGISKTFAGTVDQPGFNEGINDARQRVSFHSLRHTFASWLALQTTPILAIKELLGHRTPAMTERYSHVIPNMKREDDGKEGE
jgi:integrase